MSFLKVINIQNPSNANASIIINSAGNVGIGSVSPNELLTVAGAVTSVSNANNFNVNGAFFDYYSGGARIAAWIATGSNLQFYTNPSLGTVLERMRITSLGNVGIGTITVAAGNAVSVFGGNIQVGSTGNGVKFADGTYQSTAYTGAVTASGTLIKITYLTSGTSFTTQASTTKMFVELVGAGGGGAGTNNTSYTSSGGGAGGYSAKYFTGLTGGSSYTYAIGNGGTGGTSGTAGGNTTFTVAAVTITGNGGSGANTASGGAGGAASGGDINSNGQNGTTGFAAGGTALSGGNGTGGSSVFGGGGGSSAGYGGGGGSGAANSSTGYSGGSGLIRVWEYS